MADCVGLNVDGGAVEGRGRRILVARICGRTWLRVWIAKDFIVMNLIFVQTAPFPPVSPLDQGSALRANADVLHRVLREGRPAPRPFARVPRCVPAGYP